MPIKKKQYEFHENQGKKRVNDMQSTTQRAGSVTQCTGIKHILGIVGSPRRGANTDTLVATILESSRECGASIEKIVLQDLEIAPCKACDYCMKHGKCVHDDDMEQVVEIMEKSDTWILGTPVYWWGPSAQFKTFIDRWYGIDHRLFQGKRVLLAVPMGGGNARYARHTEGMMQDICNYLGMEYLGSVVAPGMNGRSAVKENSRILETARAKGMRIMYTEE